MRGFASSFFTKQTSGGIAGKFRDNPVGGAIAAATVGGTASVLGGGKFGNGAYTNAFQYLFNEVSDQQSEPTGGKIGVQINIDLPTSAVDKVLVFFGFEPKNIPDIGVSVGAYKDVRGDDIGLTFERRASGGLGFRFRGTLSANVSGDSLANSAGNGFSGSLQAGLYGGSLDFNEGSYIPSGSSITVAGFGFQAGAHVTATSVYSFKEDYIGSGCSKFVC